MKTKPRFIRNRKTAGTDVATYNVTRVPRDLLERAKAKCQSLTPPRPLRWQWIELLREWVEKAPATRQAPRQKATDQGGAPLPLPSKELF